MPIRTVLVANRGEIARRIVRTCHALDLRAIVTYSEGDADLPFVREADQAVYVPSYLNGSAIVHAARRVYADAVHPGYGFLSENADFARLVRENGLTWIGPPVEAIEAMADKGAARRLAIAHDVPVVPGFDGSQDDDRLIEAARAIGFPVLIKAVAGGGGRGMRRVDDPEALPEAIASARREAQSAFGNGDLILERYVDMPRHVEIQVFADVQGNCVHLFERECSIQRRHQKIVEEAPSPGVDPELRARMGEAAVRIAKAAGYRGAGTVEFILDASGAFYFLEMNTRLQVEHPVTELVTGLDLVALQIAVADGLPLPVRQEELQLNGHAIEVRIYAEDPMRDWLPGTGTLQRFDIPGGDGIRVDAGFEAGNVVSPLYDSMLAKVIAWGPDRGVATKRLQRCIERAWIPGVVNNLPLLRQILAHHEWREGDLDTHFLQRTGLPVAPPLNLTDGALAGTLLGWLQRRDRYPAPTGWRMGGPALQRDTWRCLDQTATTAWRPWKDGIQITFEVPGEMPWTATVRLLRRDGDAHTLEIDHEVRRIETWRIAHVPQGPHADLRDGDRIYVHTGLGEAFVTLEPRFPAPSPVDDDPGSAHAPTPGTVTAVHVEAGQAVTKGQRLVTLEAMKMEHAVTAPEDGTVLEVRVAVGDAVDEGTLLARLEPVASEEP